MKQKERANCAARSTIYTLHSEIVNLRPCSSAEAGIVLKF